MGQRYEVADMTLESIDAVPLKELPKCCVDAINRGQRVVTYRCNECGTLRQFETSSGRVFRLETVKCKCGSEQQVNLF